MRNSRGYFRGSMECTRRLALCPLVPRPTCFRFGWQSLTPDILKCGDSESRSRDGTGFGPMCQESQATQAFRGRITSCSWRATRISATRTFRQSLTMSFDFSPKAGRLRTRRHGMNESGAHGCLPFPAAGGQQWHPTHVALCTATARPRVGINSPVGKPTCI